MPYKIFNDGGKFCVYKHDDAGNKVGSSHGCHPTKKNAVEQLRALYAAETKEMIKSLGLSSDGVKGIEHDGERYLILWTSNAFRDREGETFQTDAWKDYVARRDAKGTYDRVWFWHMKGTDFADIVWEDVVGRVLVDVARLDHTEYADKMWHAITHPEDYADVAPLGWGTSHGYAYRLGDKQDGVYSFVEKFESTVLPYHRASNIYGGIKEVVNMAVTKEKRDALSRLVGQQLADQTLEDAEKATSVLEQAGISFKEGDDEDFEEAEDLEEEAEEEVVNDNLEAEEEADDEQLYELEITDELVKEIAAQVDVAAGVKEAMGDLETSVKEAVIAELTPLITSAVNNAVAQAMSSMQGSKEQIVQDALSGKIRMTPYSASRSQSTIAPDDLVAESKEATKNRKKQDVVGSVVARMLSGQ